MIKKILITLASTCLIAAPAFAGNENKQPEVITISLLDTIPYAFRKDDGSKTGYFYDIVTLISQKLPYETKIAIAAPNRIVRDLPRNAFNCIMAVNSDFISSNSGFHVDTNLNLQVGILPNKSTTLSSYEDLQGKRIAVVKGTTFDPKFDTDTNINKDFTPNYISSAKMLHAERVHGASGVITSLRYSAKTSGIDPQDFGEPLIFATMDVWFSCNPEFAQNHDLSHLEKVITQLRDEGHFQRIQDKYLK